MANVTVPPDLFIVRLVKSALAPVAVIVWFVLLESRTLPELHEASVSTIFPHDSIVPVLFIWPRAVNVSVPLTVKVEETVRIALPEVILVVTLLNTVEPGVIVPPLVVMMSVPLL